MQTKTEDNQTFVEYLTRSLHIWRDEKGGKHAVFDAQSIRVFLNLGGREFTVYDKEGNVFATVDVFDDDGWLEWARASTSREGILIADSDPDGPMWMVDRSRLVKIGDAWFVKEKV